MPPLLNKKSDKNPEEKTVQGGQKRPFGGRDSKSQPYSASRGSAKPFREKSSERESKSFRDRPERGERKPFRGRSERRERKPFRESSSEGERKSFGDRPERGARRPFREGSERRERKPFRERFERGERRPFRESYTRDKNAFQKSERAPKDLDTHDFASPTAKETIFRKDGRTCFLWGFHTVIAALLNKKRVKKQLFITERAHTRLLRDMPGLFERTGVPLSVMHPDALKKRFFGAVHQGVVLEAEPLRPDSFESFLQREGALTCVALDDVRDPQNVGALFRTAFAFSADGILLPSEGLPPLDGALAKAAAGALDKIPFFRVPNLSQAFEKAKKADMWCWGLSEDGVPLRDAPEVTRHMLVLGTEGKGLGPLLKKRLDGVFQLPTNPKFPTLNVHVAAAVGLALLQHKAVIK